MEMNNEELIKRFFSLTVVEQNEEEDIELPQETYANRNLKLCVLVKVVSDNASIDS